MQMPTSFPSWPNLDQQSCYFCFPIWINNGFIIPAIRGLQYLGYLYRNTLVQCKRVERIRQQIATQIAVRLIFMLLTSRGQRPGGCHYQRILRNTLHYSTLRGLASASEFGTILALALWTIGADSDGA